MSEIKKIKIFRKEDALVNKLDKVETKKPMHISDLPPEMFQLIYQFLPKKDLENCLKVNVQWHCNANDSPFWKERCKKYGLEDEGEKTELAGGSYQNLCRPARICFAFLNSPAFKWKTNSPTLYHIKDNYKFCHHHKDFKTLSNRSAYIECLIKYSQPKTVYKLNPAIQTIYCDYLGKKFALFPYKVYTYYLIYKFEGNNLNFHFAVGLKNKKPYVIDCFDELGKSDGLFLEELFDDQENRMLFQVGINKKYIKYWIDLRTKMISEPIGISGQVKQLTENHMIVERTISYNQEIITVYDHEGSNPRTLDGVFKDYKANNNVFLGINTNYEVESWDMKTGKRLQSFQNISDFEYLFSVLHTSNEIVYIKRKNTGVKAINVRTGETIWENNAFDIVENLHLVFGKYLVEYSASGTRNRKYFIVLDVIDGSCLYRRKIPIVSTDYNIETICGDYILLRGECKDLILSYSS